MKAMKKISKEIVYFVFTMIVAFLLVMGLSQIKPVFAGEAAYTVNVYAQVEGKLASNPTTLSSKHEGDYVEFSQVLSLEKDGKTYLLKSWEDATANGLPKYTYRNVDVAKNKAILGFYMPARVVNIKAVYEEAPSYNNNTNQNWRRINDAESMTGSLWQVSDIYVPITATYFNTLTNDYSASILDGVGDTQVYTANPFLNGDATYTKTVTFDAGSVGSETKSYRAGDLVVYAVPYEYNGYYINDSSVTLAGVNKALNFITNATAYTGDNTLFLTRYVMDSDKNRYVLLIFTMPDDDVVISASYPNAIPVPTATPVTAPKTLSSTIKSKGEKKINFEDGRAPVWIDTDEIQKNRDDIIALQKQMGDGEEKRIYSYYVGDHIYFVTGDHTSVYGLDENKALAIINAEKAGEPFVTYNGSDITLILGGNSTWQQVY